MAPRRLPTRSAFSLPARVATAEDEARDDLFLRQVGVGGEGDFWRAGKPVDDDLKHGVLDLGFGHEAQVWVERALHGDAPLGEVEAFAKDIEPAPDQFEKPVGGNVGGGAPDAQTPAQFGIQPAAAYEDTVWCIDREIEREGARGATAVLGLDQSRALAGGARRGGFVDMFQVRQ